MVSITPKTRTIVNGTPNDATPVETTIGELYNNDQTLATALTAVETSYVSLSSLIGVNATAQPLYGTTSSVTVARTACMNHANTRMIVNASNISVDLNSVGVNGLLQSANQAGTITVSSGGTSVTGFSTSFTTVFQVGDVIRTNGGQSRRITVITSNTAMTVQSAWSSNETTVAFKRGGKAPSTWYHLYAIGNGSAGALAFTTRSTANSDALVDLPAGYTDRRQLAFSVRTDDAGNILRFIVAEGWPQRPKILFNSFSMQDSSGNAFRLSQFGAQSWTDFIVPLMPSTSRVGVFGAHVVNTSPSAGVEVKIRPKNETGSNGIIIQNSGLAGDTWQSNLLCVTDNLQTVQVECDPLVGSFSLFMQGFVVTEVI
jgi:hypothetical protein